MILTGLALLLAAVLGERAYYLKNRGFSISKIVSSKPSVKSQVPPEVDSLLNQSFHFIGAGGTSFVFLGDDKKTILKLFKHHQLYFKHSLFHLAFPAPCDAWRIKKILLREKEHRHKRHHFFFNSCQLAFNELKEETGLIYFCSSPNPHFDGDVLLYDAWGIPHTLHLSQTEFALQKRATLLFPHLKALIEQRREEEAKKAIDAFLAIIVTRCKKGIGDRDPNLRINFGFVDGKAIEFDLGSYYSDPSLKNLSNTAREAFFMTIALQKWLENLSPELSRYLLQQIASIHRDAAGCKNEDADEASGQFLNHDVYTNAEVVS